MERHEGDRKPQVVVPRGSNAQLSPDGHWLAYHSAESGLMEAYVTALGGGQGKWQVSSNGGMPPPPAFFAATSKRVPDVSM
jgi:Tol biopolymer transport system component